MPDGLILTNVRLTADEHRAAKQRALDLGVSLSELLRRGLALTLADADSSRSGAREVAPGYAAKTGADPSGSGDGRHARAVLARTAGALRHYDTWMAEVRRLRDEGHRQPSWPGGGHGSGGA